MTEPKLPPATEPLPSQRPESRLNRLLAGRRDILVSAAESCSGGEVAHRLTAIAGSSNYFAGSIVAYSNDAKVALLGVSQHILQTRGAVSEDCARAMAEGSRKAFGSSLAVSTTGIAGPGGGTARKPVGLVYIAVATPDGTTCDEHQFPGDRGDVVDAAAEAALQMLAEAAERYLAGSPPPVKSI